MGLIPLPNTKARLNSIHKGGWEQKSYFTKPRILHAGLSIEILEWGGHIGGVDKGPMGKIGA